MTQNSNYVAAWVDYKTDKVVVVERADDSSLMRKSYNPPYYFYVPDEDGKHTSIYGDKLTKLEFDNKDEFESAKRQCPVKFESDIKPLKRILMDKYYGKDRPLIHYAFLDIEVDYKSSIGFAGPTNPYGEINAVTIYQSWTRKFLTYVLPPKINGVAWDKIAGNTVKSIYAKFDELCAVGQLRSQYRPQIVICQSERELVNYMLAALEEADIISGWNSEFYDIPYICERLLKLGGERLLGKLDYTGCRLPRKEMQNKFGSDEPVYKLTGKSHLDYMALFKKFTFEGRVSYSLGNILQEEVGVGKLDYEGTLEELYHNDFVLFTLYNYRDVDGLVQLDAKFKFIALANQMAHENTVLFEAVLGTVSYVETGIANHAHNVLNRIVHDKKISNHDKVEGAIVLTPKIGLHGWLAAVDIKSLYPNVVRGLNISPEMIIGQFELKEQAWLELYNTSQTRLCCTLESGEQFVDTAENWKKLLENNKWAVSAYGTIFDQSRGNGVVSDILGFWYNERKRLQAEKKKWGKEVQRLKSQLGVELPTL